MPFVYGTLVSSFLSLLFAVPLAIGVAVFLTEMCPGFLRGPLAFLTELLAAIPSIIYGLWAVFVLVPLLREHVNPVLIKMLGWTASSATTIPPGSVFSPPAVILAIMILPIISSLTREVMTAVPHSQREAVLALGATRWEMIRMGVLRNARIGIVGAIILGLGRALGETMAVTMVIGNTPEIQPVAAGQWQLDGLGDRQRICRGRQRHASERADGDWSGAVHRHHHRERNCPPAGLGGHARGARAGALESRERRSADRLRSGLAEKVPTEYQLRARIRRLTDGTATALAVLSTVLVIAPLVAIFVYLIYKGASSLNLDFFTKIPTPVGETGGGMANAIVGLGHPAWPGQPDRRSHGHWRRHLSGRVRPRHQAGQCRPLHRRRAQRRSLHRHGHRRLLADRRSAGIISRPSPAAWRWAS